MTYALFIGKKKRKKTLSARRLGEIPELLIPPRAQMRIKKLHHRAIRARIFAAKSVLDVL